MTGGARGYVLWATTGAGAARRTVPHNLSPSSPELTLSLGPEGMAVCLLAWVPVQHGSNHQLVAIESAYFKDAANQPVTTNTLHNGAVTVRGSFTNQTAAVSTALAAEVAATSSSVQTLIRTLQMRQTPPAPLDASYIFNCHKDPWFTSFSDGRVRWHEVPSWSGYPALASTVLSAGIWADAITMAAELLVHTETGSFTEDQLRVIAMCALTAFAGMYNATEETEDDRKCAFFSLGTNGDCDDMAITCAAVANHLLQQPVTNEAGSLAAKCHQWLLTHVSEAVVVLGFAVAKVTQPVPGGGEVTVDPKAGGGHCWAALLPKRGAAEPFSLEGAELLEGTRMTYTWTAHTGPDLKRIGFPHAPVYSAVGEASQYAHCVKPLNAQQYMSVVYAISSTRAYLITDAAATHVGSPWGGKSRAHAIAPDRVDLYGAIERRLQVPLRHVYDLATIEAQCALHRDEWDGNAYGGVMQARPMGELHGCGGRIKGMCHCNASMNTAMYTLGFGVSFGIRFTD